MERLFYYTAMEGDTGRLSRQNRRKKRPGGLAFQFKKRGRERVDFERAKLPEGDKADRLVERALFLAATGYTYVEERVETAEKTGEKVIRTRKQVGPSVTAIALWLSHRMPERWGDGVNIVQENNLLTLLRAELEGGETDGVSSVQPQAATGADLVEQAGAAPEGRPAL